MSSNDQLLTAWWAAEAGGIVLPCGYWGLLLICSSNEIIKGQFGGCLFIEQEEQEDGEAQLYGDGSVLNGNCNRWSSFNVDNRLTGDFIITS